MPVRNLVKEGDSADLDPAIRLPAASGRPAVTASGRARASGGVEEARRLRADPAWPATQCLVAGALARPRRGRGSPRRTLTETSPWPPMGAFVEQVDAFLPAEWRSIRRDPIPSPAGAPPRRPSRKASILDLTARP
jgi:hypothetical protein